MKRLLLFCLMALAFCPSSEACTSVIFSSRVTADGRPLLWKNRDTDSLDNRLAFYQGEIHAFTALVNAYSEEPQAWAGSNVAGFSIMNTASYNLKEDLVPQSQMDREGLLMYRALGICRDLADFEHFLDTLSRPMGVEANFGVIDAHGGAACYEVCNDRWVKYDVNDPEVAPDGYLVVTNFSRSGREEDRKGWERYLTACAIFSGMTATGPPFDLTPHDLFNGLSRSLRHEVLGVDYLADHDRMEQAGLWHDWVVDQDFIPRRITSASILMKGVKPGEDPLHGVIWTILGYPFTGPAIPVPVASTDIIPSYMKCQGEQGRCTLSDLSGFLKGRYVFSRTGSNGSHYMDLSQLLPEHGSIPDACRRAEAVISAQFDGLYDSWAEGELGQEEFLLSYKIISETFLHTYVEQISDFL